MEKLTKDQMEAILTTVRAMTIFQAGILMTDDLPDASVFKREMKKTYRRLQDEMRRFEMASRAHIDTFNEFISDEYKLVMFNEAERIVNDLKSVEVEIKTVE